MQIKNFNIMLLYIDRTKAWGLFDFSPFMTIKNETTDARKTMELPVISTAWSIFHFASKTVATKKMALRKTALIWRYGLKEWIAVFKLKELQL